MLLQNSRAHSCTMILVVDDEPESRTLLTEILTAEGYAVRVADSGPLALRSLALMRPELILLDVKMPEMDGFETCRRFKEHPDLRSIPVIFLSGSVDSADRVEGFRVGGIDFISKPLQREEMLARVRTHLQLSTLRAHLEEQVTQKTAKLRESEERFRFAQKAANIGTFDWNVKTGVHSWTPELEAIYGLPPGGFSGTRQVWEELIHPDDRKTITARVDKSLETGTPTKDEWRIVWPDGSIHWIAGRWQALKDGPAGSLRVLGIIIEVTDRKNTEEALRKSEERFRLAMKATNDSIWDIDLKTGIVSWNDTYANLYGRPSETSDSWQWWIENIHPEDRESTVAELRSAIAGNPSTWTCEYRFRRFGGEWAYIYDRAYIARDASGTPSRVIGAMQDLTEQKKSEAALRESEQRFRRVFEDGPLGIALVARDYRIIKVNSAFCQMLGYDEADLIGLSFVDFTHPDDVAADLKLAERLFAREIPSYQIEKRYLKKSREIIWAKLNASLVVGSGGEPLYGIAMLEDITAIKRTQEEALLRQKLESVGALAGGIAHDFNNLLGAVQAQTELALSELDAGVSCRKELETIGKVATRGAEVVRQLMIYAGKESALVEPVNFSKVVDEMLSLLEVSVSKHAVIRADLDFDLPPILASAAQIRQIVMNLITNASDAIGDRDGVIGVITRRITVGSESAEISPPTLPDGDYAVLEVCDTGRGMTPETQAKVFDPFFTTKSAGRGLGLAVIQGIIRTLGGTIHVASEPGKGTTFRVLLPLIEAATSAPPPSTSGDGELEVQSRRGVVLVVEDEGNLRRPIVKLLRRSGFEVFEAAEGNSAIDILRANGTTVDVILLDMTIPGASSQEIIAEARNIKPDVRLILTSAYSWEMIERTISAPQIHSFIRKPFLFGDLLENIRNCLS